MLRFNDRNTLYEHKKILLVIAIFFALQFSAHILYAYDATINAYGGLTYWNDATGYSGMLQGELDNLAFMGFSAWNAGIAAGVSYTTSSSLSYIAIPLMLSSGYTFTPFALPVRVEPLLFAGPFIGHRYDDVGNSDTRVGITAFPALQIFYPLSASWSLSILGGYAYSYTSAYSTRTLQVFVGASYRCTASEVIIDEHKDDEMVSKQTKDTEQMPKDYNKK